jgi:lysozyme family protein
LIADTSLINDFLFVNIKKGNYMNFDSAFAKLLMHEGGFSDHKDDPGGKTNFGITEAVARKHGFTGDMRSLSAEVAKRIYQKDYWDAISADELPAEIRYAMFDAAVNSGPGRAAKWLQACVGVEPDGGIGPKTLAAVNAFDATQLIEDYAKRRLSFLMDLQTWETFGKGWGRRVAEVQKTGLDMA